jgi:tetratricopeptide (TPR) repeat protein
MDMTKPTIALAAIMRDEADNLVRCLDAAAKIVNKVVLVDTGSEDDTIRFAREWSERTGVPLVLHEEPWQNFRENRSSLLRHAEKEADWILMLDIDLVLHAPDPLPDLDGADCWHGRIAFSSLSYTLPFLIRAGKPWRYEGVAHSYLACDEPYDEAEMPGLWVEDYSHTTIKKLEQDLVALSTEHAKNPLDTRTVFYLAQTYYDLDRYTEAIHYYRMRANMDGWDEEVYFARYRLGCLLCEHVSFLEGAKELLQAWDGRPSRAEVLRVLANVAGNVADKIPPSTDRLFVTPDAYKQPTVLIPPVPPLDPTGCVSRSSKGRLLPTDVSAVIVTRGNVDLMPILETIPFKDIVIWNNAEREHDYKVFGRYAAIPEAKNPVIYWQDDDVIFTAFDELLAAYEPGRVVVNMDQAWIDGAGYQDSPALMGAGSLCDAQLPAQIFAQYLAVHPFDDDLLVEADFAFGTLAPWKRVDLGYQVRTFSDDADRLYMQENQTRRKWAMILRCRAMLTEIEKAA